MLKHTILGVVIIAVVTEANIFDSLFSTNSNSENDIYVFHGSNIRRFYDQRANYLRYNVLNINPDETDKNVWFIGNSEEKKMFETDFMKKDAKNSNIIILDEDANNFAEHLVCMMSKWFETKNHNTVVFHHIVHSTAIPRMEHIIQQIHAQGLQQGLHGTPLKINHKYCPIHFSLRHNLDYTKSSLKVMNHDFKWSSKLEHDILENNVYNDVQNALYNTKCGQTLTMNLKKFGLVNDNKDSDKDTNISTDL